MAKAARKSLVLVGGNNPKKRVGVRRSWTKAKQAAFIEALAETCNVSAAARFAGVSPTYAYAVRQKDAAFRAAWDQAIAEAYSRLEMELLKRALHGVEETVTRGGETRTIRKYSDAVALTLLRTHRETAALAVEAVDDGEAEEAKARIVERLARIREKVEGGVETKGLDRVALIAWGLGMGSRHGSKSRDVGPVALMRAGRPAFAVSSPKRRSLRSTSLRLGRS